MQQIKRVHVVYKTHLDIGFTDLARNVTDKYIKDFIPKAIKIAYKVNKKGENKRFIWTVGSWLIDEYLRRSDEKGKLVLIDAINKGYIVWHAIPFTTHSELMDEELFNFGISISKELDNRFSKNTIAAKMSDVPGHTRGIIEPLCRNGIKYLHIGVNGSSHKPNVPDVFVWRDSKGNEIIVDYCQGYGQTTIIPGMEDALVFAHSMDNLGPQSEEDINKQLENIQRQFPDSEVMASTLDNYARELIKIKDILPVVTEEIGDTWIHGTASDPYKVSCYLELLRMKDEWIREGKLQRGDKGYKEFLRNLLMIPEHTWGLDSKKYLPDFKNWSKQDFVKAREKNYFRNEYIPEKYSSMANFDEYSEQVNSAQREIRSYSYFESSHEEQRGYLTSAVKALPAMLQEEAAEKLNGLKQKPKINRDSLVTFVDEKISLSGYSITILKNGSIKLIGNGFKNEVILGNVSYELFGMKTFKNWENNYMVNMKENYFWAAPDFFKPGIEECGAPSENINFVPNAEKCYISGNDIIIEAKFNDYECSEYGCPRDLFIKYTFHEKEIDMSAYLSEKDASRMPEALWISFFKGCSHIKNITAKKIGEDINLFDVVKCGNRNYHSIKALDMDVDNSSVNIVPLDSPLLSIGEKRLYNFKQDYADLKGGIHFNLYNNLWGTNFKMWYEEDMISRFIIKIK